MDDNLRFPKDKIEAKDDLIILLETLINTKEKYKAKELIKIIVGEKNAIIISHKTHLSNFFGKGVMGSYPSSVTIKLSPTCDLKLFELVDPSTAKTIPGFKIVLFPTTGFYIHGFVSNN